MIQLGRELLAIKAKLPKGHFMPWIEEKSGISYTAAQRFMRAAKDADTAQDGQGARVVPQPHRPASGA